MGQLVHKSGANHHLEINFNDEENKNETIAKGLQFDNGYTIIRPAVGLTPSSIIKKINLQRLPWIDCYTQQSWCYCISTSISTKSATKFDQ
ncbi:hypothetical protein RO3G_00810 [Rhizopus delemar RA 99-880]|uniref:Uncharacterized protein n=1 Tax=Rhizopus delemar (strain RA 99-880 / ATCC MYA-4621 / FGSC 9543 / NRRL 43880) TaxID=246409 RepID=I1BIS6_RHIO9|nr:hypothetical protein RO3G_00810 [Rhizopus delemar RA 99-880]|eukprot:EIE76106.1 hypothetical protein RO3G_00810 [Rhizopus delemar RA 99-880]